MLLHKLIDYIKKNYKKLEKSINLKKRIINAEKRISKKLNGFERNRHE